MPLPFANPSANKYGTRRPVPNPICMTDEKKTNDSSESSSKTPKSKPLLVHLPRELKPSRKNYPAIPWLSRKLDGPSGEAPVNRTWVFWRNIVGWLGIGLLLFLYALLFFLPWEKLFHHSSTSGQPTTSTTRRVNDGK